MQWRLRPGVRRWLGEFSNIVLGVLVALALGAVASEIGWWRDVAGARGVIRVELGEVLGQARERQRANGCYRQKLAYLGQALSAAEASGRLPAVGAIGSPLIRTWSRGGWDSILAAETASHFDRDELDNISGVYEMVTILAVANQRELDAWSRLLAMVGPGRPLSAAEAADLRGALGQARMLNNQIALFSVRARQVADAYDVPYERRTVNEYGNVDLQVFPICQPVGAVPASYDTAPLDGALERALANPITRDSIGITRRR